MLKLYGSARSRASIVQWYLEELGVSYEFIQLDFQAGEQRQPAYLAINPIGKVPAIVDGDFKLWESGAILLYLADKHHPAATPELRGLLSQWVLYANATLGPGMFVEASREREGAWLLASLNQYLDGREFLVGDDFSAADVAVGAMLAYIPFMLKISFEEYPAIDSYLKRLVSRPAFQKTIGARFG